MKSFLVWHFGVCLPWILSRIAPKFTPLLFNKPGVPENTWSGVPQGKMTLDQVVWLLNDVAEACDVVGLAIAEHLPWNMLRLRNALRDMPLLNQGSTS